MFSRFFINRPIFASVVSILIVLFGAISYWKLPISQYPEITPPVIHVDARYPGANAQTVADSIAQLIEQNVNGVEGMMYMSSTSNSDGSYGLDVTFEIGTNVDIAAVQVQNRVAVASARLPEDVQRQGVTVKKVSTNIIQVVSIFNPHGETDDLFLANYANETLLDRLSRIKGVGDARILPPKDWSMRIWINPDRLRTRNLAVGDVINAIRAQNVEVAAGQIGQPPANKDQNFQYIINSRGRLKTKEEFGNIIIKSAGDHRDVAVKDVATVELGARSYDVTSQLDGRPSATIVIYQLPGANAVEVANAVRKMMAEIKSSTEWPAGLQYEFIYDTAQFVQTSIDEVYTTLWEAIALVVIVVLVFLQNWRSTLIPLITIPVSLIGTFGIMLAFGFSINMLTLFALVLAIGIVVDDAIVVVENVERNMATYLLPPREATIRAMSEVFAPVIAISLVLMAVFVPTAFLGGVTGQLYKQFALTIAASTLFSAINALTLSPALCAVFLRQHKEHHEPNFFARWFNNTFDRVVAFYRRTLGVVLKVPVLAFGAFAGVMALTAWITYSVPTGFIPQEDNGFFVLQIQLPDGASQRRTLNVLHQINDILDTSGVNGEKDVRNKVALAGFSFMGSGSNVATMFVRLSPWSDRLPRGRDIGTIIKEVQGKLMGVQEARAFAFQLPAIPGLGTTSGFDMRIKDNGNVGREALEASTFAMMLTPAPNVGQKFSTYRANVPQIYVDPNREKILNLNIPLANVNQALSAMLGSAYVNDFNLNGRTYQVNVQALPEFRATASDIAKLEVRGPRGMVPLGSLVKITDTVGPERISRYNLAESSSLQGGPPPGGSSGDAIASMEALAKQVLRPGQSYEWTGMSFQETRTAGQGATVFGLGIIVVYMILAAQYESWSLPISIAMSVPLAVIGAMLMLIVRGMDNNIFTQIGLVLLVGLAAKNAILIVEFARQQRAQGMGIVESAIEASALRLRPILMTSFAFILGVTPLMLAHGAGANARQSLGTSVFGGMLGATLLGLLFIPVLYVLVQTLAEKLGFASKPNANEDDSPAHAGD